MSIHPHHHKPRLEPEGIGSAVGVRIPRNLAQGALERLIVNGNPKIGAQRLIRNAAAHGIDLDLIWGVLGDVNQGQPGVRQVCMMVPGSGGTGMCFVSNPRIGIGGTDPGLGDEATQVDEIGAALESAIREVPFVGAGRVRTAQMLFEPKLDWTHSVCARAGMISVGTLDYLRMDFGLISRWEIDSEPWPEGIEVRVVRDLSMSSAEGDGSRLAAALERSYEDTLDCPELCGMRSMEDVIASHRSTGVFDPSRWWLMLKDTQPVGCCLLSHCPANESVELVYIGMGPEVQGQGLGSRLLRHALCSLRINDEVHEVCCAVDRRNTPAMRLYERLGFKRFDARCGYVCKV